MCYTDFKSVKIWSDLFGVLLSFSCGCLLYNTAVLSRTGVSLYFMVNTGFSIFKLISDWVSLSKYKGILIKRKTVKLKLMKIPLEMNMQKVQDKGFLITYFFSVNFQPLNMFLFHFYIHSCIYVVSQ